MSRNGAITRHPSAAGHARRVDVEGHGAKDMARVGRAQGRRSQPDALVAARTHPHPARVLMTADCVGGVWTYALDLARGLAEAGVEILLATMGDLPNETQRADANRIPGLTLCSSAYKLEWMPDCWRDVERAGEWLLDLAAHFAPDVVHLNGYAHGGLAWNAPVLVVGHSCVFSWWQAVRNEPAPPEWERYGREVAQGIGAADCVAAPTQAMLNALARHYGPLPPSVVIPNGRRHDIYAPGVKEPFILSAGRVWDEAKNVAALERVAPALAWPVYVAGSPQPPGEIMPDADSPVLPQDGTFHPLGSLPCDVLASWYSRAAVYALPARYEPFGLSALEAALSGCALVLGDIASLREVWGETALFVPPDDDKALLRALGRLTADPELRLEMAQRALRQARSYTLHSMTAAYLDAYASLLAPAQGDRFPHESPASVPGDVARYMDFTGTEGTQA